jgi:hypothetical protein
MGYTKKLHWFKKRTKCISRLPIEIGKNKKVEFQNTLTGVTSKISPKYAEKSGYGY